MQRKLKLPSTSQMALGLGRHKLAVAIKFFAIAIVIVALYAQDLSIIFTGALNDEASFHILAIPLLFGYLLYRKRKMISASLQQPPANPKVFLKYFSPIAGVALFATAILTIGTAVTRLRHLSIICLLCLFWQQR
jgi:hypothetical protein